MIDTQSLNLFGLDLNGLFRRVILAFRQLFFDDESPVKARFSAAERFYDIGDLGPEADNAEPNESELALSIQLLAPEPDVLELPLTLPINVEPYLDEAVRAQALSATPFSESETCWGHVISGRSTDELTLALVIISRAAANEILARAKSELSDPSIAIDLWAATSSSKRAPFIQFQSGIRQRAYLTALRRFATRYTAGLIGVLCLISTPVVIVKQSLGQYEQMLVETEARTSRIVEVRAALEKNSQQVSEAGEFFMSQRDYRPWLHKMAEVTPDSIYLNRMSFSGSLLTISGLAENAADYQSKLSQERALDKLIAPSAFTLDSRSGRERFTLSMEIGRLSEQ